jgi:hypothetical protein
MSEIEEEAYREVCEENERLRSVIRAQKLGLENLGKELERLRALCGRAETLFRGYLSLNPRPDEVRELIPQLKEAAR